MSKMPIRGFRWAAMLFTSVALVGSAIGGETARAQQANDAGAAQPCGAAMASAGAMATPATADQGTTAANLEFDQGFIDMAIPHHAAIVSAAGAALPRLQNPELRAVAVDIILDQAVEVEKLRDLRQILYGASLPTVPDESMMTTMMGVPGMESMDPGMMMMFMDPVAMAAQICAAPDTDLAFIDLTVAHHQAAVMMAQTAVDQASSPDLRSLAAHSVATQQAQIDELLRVRDELGATGA